MTSASKPLAEHFQKLGREIKEKFIKSKNDLVVEIGSNDGVLLESIKSKCRVLGIDPAFEVSREALKRGVPTLHEFFGSRLAKIVKRNIGSAKVVLANNVMAHIDDITDVFVGVQNLLRSDGVFIFEAHWVVNLIGEGGYDQIYHEHLSYYSLHSLKVLLGRTGLKLIDAQIVPIHGASLRVFAAKTGTTSKRTLDLLQKEKDQGILSGKAFESFAGKAYKNKKDLKALLAKLKKGGKRIVGYGAPAKGNTLLNFCGITADTIDYITDTTPLKQGLYASGSRIPIVSPSQLLKKKLDYILLLSWNYAEAILEKEKALRNMGVKFIIPVPDITIL